MGKALGEIMPRAKNAMEIFKHLDKSNCRECGEKTCLAFAGAVYQSRKDISMCPRLDQEVVDRFSDETAGADTSEEMGAQYISDLKKSLAGMDLAGAAARSGGRYTDGKLMLKVMGKDFGVNADGDFSTDIHVNPWVAGPFLD